MRLYALLYRLQTPMSANANLAFCAVRIQRYSYSQDYTAPICQDNFPLFHL